MKQLLLWRHAKSDWYSGTIDDHDRPLNARGEKAANAMAAYLAEHHDNIDLIFCSSAKRTQMTMAPLAQHLKATDIKIVADLYHASSIKMLHLLQTVNNDNHHKIMMIGHNPGIQDFTLKLSHTETGPYYATAQQKFVTGSCALLDCPIENWADLTWKTAQLRNYIRPKDLT